MSWRGKKGVMGSSTQREGNQLNLKCGKFNKINEPISWERKFSIYQLNTVYRMTLLCNIGGKHLPIIVIMVCVIRRVLIGTDLT